jgi:hypothetical protein
MVSFPQHIPSEMLSFSPNNISPRCFSFYKKCFFMEYTYRIFG